jgi:type VII secretion-associated serine protease mycosin
MTSRRRAVAYLVGALVLVLWPTPAMANDAVRDSQWHLRYLRVSDAHKFSQGEGITVAVIDTGVDPGRPDLAGSVLPGIDTTSAGSGDGLTDADGHGTAMASLIVAHGRSLGIAPNSMVQAVRVSRGSFAGGSARNGINWAVAHGARVICLARGEPNSRDLRAAVERAIASDIVVVAAAGNTPDDQAVTYPAAYSGVIAAAGVDKQGRHAAFSVSGPQVVLAAPAVDIVSAGIPSQHNGYPTTSGTSDATAIIAGAAALVRSRFPQMSAAEVVHRLTATADDKGPPGRDDEYGFGVVNLVKALTADVPPLQPTTTTAASSPSIGPTTATEPTPRNGTTAVLAWIGVTVIVIAIGVTWAVRRSRA